MKLSDLPAWFLNSLLGYCVLAAIGIITMHFDIKAMKAKIKKLEDNEEKRDLRLQKMGEDIAVIKAISEVQMLKNLKTNSK